MQCFNNKEIELICRLNKDWQAENIKVKKAGGQTNRNYIVQQKNKKFFVRLPWEAAGIVDRKVEAGNVLVLVKCKKLSGILPKCFVYIFKQKNIVAPENKEVFDLPDGAQVLGYIAGKDIDGKDLEKPKIQRALLEALCCFHKSRVKFVNRYDVFRDEVVKYKKKAKKYSIYQLVKKEQIEKIEEIEKIARKNLKQGGAISTHNDLIFENLRLGKDGKVYFLDFEYGGFNIRDGLHYDLGIILGGNLFQKNPIKIETYNQILKLAEKIYGKKISPAKAYYGALTNILVMFWWGLVKYFTCEESEKKYFENYVLERANKVESIFQLAK